MFNLRKHLAWCVNRLDSDAGFGFVLGSALTLSTVLMVNLLSPSYVVEKRVLEVARQSLHGIPLPP